MKERLSKSVRNVGSLALTLSFIAGLNSAARADAVNDWNVIEVQGVVAEGTRCVGQSLSAECRIARYRIHKSFDRESVPVRILVLSR